MRHVWFLVVGFVFTMACTAGIAMGDVAAATASPDLATLVDGLPLSANWKALIFAFFALVVVFRWIAEALFALANYLNKPGMSIAAVGIYKVVRAIGSVFGYFGMGTPKEMISAKIDAATKAQADGSNPKTGG